MSTDWADILSPSPRRNYWPLIAAIEYQVETKVHQARVYWPPHGTSRHATPHPASGTDQAAICSERCAFQGNVFAWMSLVATGCRAMWLAILPVAGGLLARTHLWLARRHTASGQAAGGGWRGSWDWSAEFSAQSQRCDCRGIAGGCGRQRGVPPYSNIRLPRRGGRARAQAWASARPTDEGIR